MGEQDGQAVGQILGVDLDNLQLGQQQIGRSQCDWMQTQPLSEVDIVAHLEPAVAGASKPLISQRCKEIGLNWHQPAKLIGNPFGRGFEPHPAHRPKPGDHRRCAPVDPLEVKREAQGAAAV